MKKVRKLPGVPKRTSRRIPAVNIAGHEARHRLKKKGVIGYETIRKYSK
jgi:hypothetical protein